MVIHSEDAFAPVGYLNLTKARLEDKHVVRKIMILSILMLEIYR